LGHRAPSRTCNRVKPHKKAQALELKSKKIKRFQSFKNNATSSRERNELDRRIRGKRCTFSPLFTRRYRRTCHCRIHPMARERDGVKK
jgi:hypothetical protein